MAEECIFCRIARGDIPSATLMETETVISFLDISPVNPGHALVLPRAHYETLFDIPPGLGSDLVAAAQAVGRAVMRATGATGMNVMINSFKSAGQLVPHVHWHLIPRHDEDGLRLWPQQPYPDMDAMARLAEDVRKHIA
jgi:histidine triad (HIT) family protein